MNMKIKFISRFYEGDICSVNIAKKIRYFLLTYIELQISTYSSQNLILSTKIIWKKKNEEIFRKYLSL